jgi:ribosomal protein L21E
MNRTVEESLRSYVNANLDNWPELLPWIQSAMNSSVSAAHGFSPFWLTFGRHMVTSKLLELGLYDPLLTLEDWAQSQLRKLHQGTDLARTILQENKERMKKQHDETANLEEYEVGDLVKVRKHTVASKLESPFHGPYRVIRKQGTNYVVDLGTLGTLGTSTCSYHSRELEKWNSTSRPQPNPQDAILPTTPAQQKCLEYAVEKTKDPNKPWNPECLLNHRVAVTWTQPGARGVWSGSIADFLPLSKRFLVRYDVMSNDGQTDYEEDLLGKVPPTWKFI